MWNFFSPRLTAKYEIRTRMTKQTVLDTVAKANNEYSAAGIKYGSRVGEDGFKLHQHYSQRNGLLNSRNSFAPVAVANVREDAAGSVISVTIRMARSVDIFIRIFYLVMVVGIFSSLIECFAFFNDPSVPVLDLLSVFLLLPMWHVIIWFAYKRPAAKLKDYLDELLLL